MVKVGEMEESVVKKIDIQGRVYIPIEWRSEWKSNRVMMVRRGDRIEITPIEVVSPSSLFDSIEVHENAVFSDPHSLRKVLLELHEL